MWTEGGSGQPGISGLSFGDVGDNIFRGCLYLFGIEDDVHQGGIQEE